MTSGGRYWLRFQLGLAAVGGALWYVGAVIGSEFASGIGVGVLISALALRLLRSRAERED
ncbi:MAG: hypothetical protein M8866_02180 [marine benthic group bacterium]|nr:hypothetical protein [Candidatus Benthicola marisminoris]